MQTAPPVPSPGMPLELPRLVLRRAAVAALGVLLLALVLGLWRGSLNTDEETRSAVQLAATLTELVHASERGDEVALQRAIDGWRDGHQDLRHVRLALHDAGGRLVFESSPEVPGAASAPRVVDLPRADGSRWQLRIGALRDSERREALSGLAQMLLLVAAGCAAMLAVMAFLMRRAFAPLRGLVDAIERLRGAPPHARDAAPLPPMPIRELQVVAQALDGLQSALQHEAAQRRVLAQQMLTLQEDERQRLARELHDEFGQQLTALRVDAVWLGQRLAEAPEAARVAKGIAQRCGAIQQDIRALLTRLQPLGPRADGEDAHEPASRLAELLAALMRGWARSATQTCSFELRLVTRRADGSPAPWPSAEADVPLPHDLALVLYRASQEALTNVARHARASRAVLSLTLELDEAQRARAIDWELRDDGQGLPDPAAALQRGSGLAGLQQRVLAQGGELQFGPAWPGAEPPGLRLWARFELQPEGRA